MDVLIAIAVIVTLYYLPTVVKGIYAKVKRHRQNYRT
jgi:Flp pilus assembly pilin Flp